MLLGKIDAFKWVGSYIRNMSRSLQTKLEDAREDFSNAVSNTFHELGELYSEGYGSGSWGCSQNTRTDTISWGFKYSAEDDEIKFVCGEYSYEQPVFELNRYTYQMERQGTERQERDVYVVSQYDPANVWDVLHVSEELTDAVGRFMQDLTNFNTHPDTITELREANPSLDSAITTMKNELTSLRESAETVQSVMELSDLVDGIKNGHSDLCAIGICDDEEDKDSIWKMFNCSAEGKGLQDTRRHIHFQNEDIALVEVERWYNEWYSVAYVVGNDDGDTPFFIHRLRNAEEVDEIDEWTPEKVYNLMGFDANYDSDEIEADTRYRVQGDVYFEQRNLDEELREVVDTYGRNVAGNAVKEHAENFLEIQNASALFTVNTFISTRMNRTEREPVLHWAEEFSTDEMKEIQDDLNISEDRVREEQENRGWGRLSQNRRRTIVRDLFEERLFQWVEQTQEVDVSQVREEAEQEQREQYEDTQASCPITLGNHLLNIRNATIHPNSTRRLEEDIEVVVPEETQLYVLHDEHNSKILTLPRGIYTFGFLEQHFNA